MTKTIYTIGFTKKTAEDFFKILEKNNIDIILDIRLNNTSQLSAFTKFPDIQYFLKELNNIEYIHDTKFSPKNTTLKRYKKKDIDWSHYVTEFNDTMDERDIIRHIKDNYIINKVICLLCSEPRANNCHRSLVAKQFHIVFEDLEIIHL